MIKFIFAFVVATVFVSGASLLWPRLTSAPRPQLLQQVHDVVVHTGAGTQAAMVLGVSDESNIEPINASTIVGGAVGVLKETVQKRAEKVIIAQAITQLSSQYEGLPDTEKQKLQELICKSGDQ